MRVCPRCGYKNAGNAIYCDRCGQKLAAQQSGSRTGAPRNSSGNRRTNAQQNKSGRRTSAQQSSSGRRTGTQQNSSNRCTSAQQSSGRRTGAPQNSSGNRRTNAQQNESGRRTSAQQSSGRRTGTQQNSSNRRTSAQQNSSGRRTDVRQLSSGRRLNGRGKRKPALLQFFVLFEAVVAVLIVVLFVVYGNALYSAQGVVEKYCSAYVEGDYETMYSLTDWPDGVFLTADQYAQSMRDLNAQTPTAYTAEEEESTQTGTKTYTAEFSFNETESSTQEIVLTLQDEKGLFFFNIWKIDAQDVVAQNCVITVPSGAQTAVDGTILDDTNSTAGTSAASASGSEESDTLEDASEGESADEDVSASESVDEDDASESEDGESAADDNEETLQITVFAGSHTLQVSFPWFKVLTESFSAGGTDGNSGITITLADLELSEEGEQAFAALAQEALEQLYSGALSGRNFSLLSDLFAADSLEEAQSAYKTLDEALENAGLKGVVFSDFSYSVQANRDGTVDVTVDAHYEASYIGEASSDDEDEDSSEDDEDDADSSEDDKDDAGSSEDEDNDEDDENGDSSDDGDDESDSGDDENNSADAGEKQIGEGEYQATVTFSYDGDAYKIVGFDMESVI